MDLSSVITQVAKEDETNTARPAALNCQTRAREGKKRRLLSLLLCCLGYKRHQPNVYLPTNEIPVDNESSEKYLLPALRETERIKNCLVIDLDETLVHSSFKVYVTKRPHVDEFLQRVGELYECILFTASLSKYADPVANLLDPNNIFRARLFRESCTYYNCNYIKDLSRLGREIRKVIIIDNSPVSYIFHQDNAVPVSSWFDDMNDTELLTLIPIFERLALVDDVIPALQDLHRRC
ncbi:unnamed protein product [Didymodactylos carnosus]|uniref:FCP1 homology domain-containing protein n=1 Tax=Didymodactylos carnosus TaxID=1234261 RepID=A0A814G089_9BILA|nr:unnamed protein product [Didymodactylos carnosus]CAF0987345.1 unnamed protein product [Didymodactylos carnosus]CAF3569622.1 unnamed protein product [Didymodactylos carnosus]CAF3759504.1 unnamed protein product [Didymodactylos carnosus]